MKQIMNTAAAVVAALCCLFYETAFAMLQMVII